MGTNKCQGLLVSIFWGAGNFRSWIFWSGFFSHLLEMTLVGLGDGKRQVRLAEILQGPNMSAKKSPNPLCLPVFWYLDF